MTGITQTPDRNTSPRPEAGRRSMAHEEGEILRSREMIYVEKTVEECWGNYSPAQIAAGVRARYPHALRFITARWVESIKRRIDNRNRRP